MQVNTFTRYNYESLQKIRNEDKAPKWLSQTVMNVDVSFW